MNVTEALDEAAKAVPTESAQASALFVLAEHAKTLDGFVRKAERERLAAWFELSADTLRGFQPDGLSIEFVVFLLRLAGE